MGYSGPRPHPMAGRRLPYETRHSNPPSFVGRAPAVRPAPLLRRRTDGRRPVSRHLGQRRPCPSHPFRLGKSGAGTHLRGVFPAGRHPNRNDLPGFLGHHAPAGAGRDPLRCRVAGQQSVAHRRGHPAPGQARRVHLPHPSGVWHPAKPGPGNWALWGGTCRSRTF